MSLLNLTSIQKKAVARILLEIANADGTITKEEEMAFMVFQAFDYFSKSDVEEAKNMSVTNCLSIIKDFSYSQKESLLSNIIALGGTDGWNINEVKVLMNACKVAEIPLPKELSK